MPIYTWSFKRAHILYKFSIQIYKGKQTPRYIHVVSIPQGHCPFTILYGKFETASIKLLVVLRILNDCDIR